MKIKQLIDEQVRELRESLERRIVDGYFVHCEPKKKPDFKTSTEAEAWYKTQSYISEQIVKSWTDNTMVGFVPFFKKLIEAVGEELIHPLADMEFHEKRKVWEAEQDGFDTAIRRVDEKQRLKLKEIIDKLK